MDNFDGIQHNYSPIREVTIHRTNQDDNNFEQGNKSLTSK